MAAFDSDVDVTVELGFRGPNYMTTAGAGWVSTPNSSGLSPSTQLDLRAFVLVDEWPVAWTPLVSQFANNNRAYVFDIATRQLRLLISTGGTSTIGARSTVELPPVSGGVVGCRVTWRASDHRIQFFTSHDGGGTWVQLGADRFLILAPDTPIFNSTAEVRVAGIVDPVFEDVHGPFAGRVYSASIRTSIGGAVAGEVDFSSQGWQVDDSSGDTGSDGTNTWTLQGDAVVENAPGLFALDPTWVDVSDQVKAATFNRGRSSVQADFPAGSGTLWLDNTEGDFYSWNAASPHYPHVTVGVQVRITATHDSTSYPLFRGYVSRWPQTFPTNAEELVPVEITELFSRLEGKKVSGIFNAEKSDERIAAVLDRVGWPESTRDLDPGVAKVAGREWLKVTALFLIRTALEAEQGQVFQAANGDLTFRNRVAVSGGVPPEATFGPDGAELTYVDVTVVHDDDLLINEAIISAGELVEGERTIEGRAIDGISANTHGPVTYTTDNLSIFASPEALNVAEWIVAKHKDVKPRITGFAIDPAGDPVNLWPEVLTRELRDVVTVKVSYPGSTTQLVQNVAVESISHTFAAGGVWTVVYGCHPLSDVEQATFFILDSSLLDGADVLA